MGVSKCLQHLKLIKMMEFMIGIKPKLITQPYQKFFSQKYTNLLLTQANVNLKKEIYGQIDIRHLTG